MTDEEKAALTKTRTETVVNVYAAQLIDEDEARERLSQDDFWVDLADNPWVPSELVMLEERRKDEEADRQAAEAEQRRKEMKVVKSEKPDKDDKDDEDKDEEEAA